MNNITDKKLNKKLAKVSDDELRSLITETQKIREELGDMPEIKNIERSIVSAQSKANRRVFAAGMKWLGGISLAGIGGYYYPHLPVPKSTFQTISNLIVFSVGCLIMFNANQNMNDSVSNSKIVLIKNDIEKLKNESENIKVKKR